MKYISQIELENLLKKQDLTEKKEHCISLAIDLLRNKLEKLYTIDAEIVKGSKIVSIEDNYYHLGYDIDEITLSSRYTKYVDKTLMLRTQMSSAIPKALRDYKKDGDKLYLCPGIVYRRDVRDKTHVGEPHQMDIWYLTEEQKSRKDLLELVSKIIEVIEDVIKEKIEWRYNETNHNYTDEGIEVEINYNGKWLEILECGLISKLLLKEHNLEGYSGLALGMGLERLVMIIKGIEDIRVLLDTNPRVQEQMRNLKKYKVVSKQPETKRDLSIAVDKDMNLEEITEEILSSISSEEGSRIESINVLCETEYEKLPDVAKERLGLSKEQKNVLLRIILRDLSKSISSKEANEIYTKIYEIIHKGIRGYKI